MQDRALGAGPLLAAQLCMLRALLPGDHRPAAEVVLRDDAPPGEPP